MKKVMISGVALLALAALPVVMAAPRAAPAQMTGAHSPMMKKPMWSAAAHKAWVEKVQRALDAHGAHLKVDGRWGPMTMKALEAFQKSHGLKASGHVDGATATKLGLAHWTAKKPEMNKMNK